MNTFVVVSKNIIIGVYSTPEAAAAAAADHGGEVVTRVLDQAATNNEMTQTKTKTACSPAGEPHNHQQPDSHAVDGRSNASAMENSVYLTAMSRPCASSATNESTPDQSSSQLQEFEPSRVLVPESSLLSSLSPDLATSDGPFVPESPIQPYTPQSMSSAQSNVTGTAGHSDPMAYASQYQLLNDAESHVCDVRGWCQNSDGICSFEKDKRV